MTCNWYSLWQYNRYKKDTLKIETLIRRHTHTHTQSQLDGTIFGNINFEQLTEHIIISVFFEIRTHNQELNFHIHTLFIIFLSFLHTDKPWTNRNQNYYIIIAKNKGILYKKVKKKRTKQTKNS